MADVMDGPTLRVGGRVVHTFLFALLDDCSRLVPHGQYYDNEKFGPLLDCVKEAFKRRGLPEKLYTDQGKIFTCAHLQVVCANLKIKLLRPALCRVEQRKNREIFSNSTRRFSRAPASGTSLQSRSIKRSILALAGERIPSPGPQCSGWPISG